MSSFLGTGVGVYCAMVLGGGFWVKTEVVGGKTKKEGERKLEENCTINGVTRLKDTLS